MAVASADCPITVASDKAYVAEWPHGDTWFGSKDLAVMLPANGIWPTTVEGHGIAVKLFWYSVGLQPGMERDFVARIERLGDGPNDAVMSEATNAGHANDVWTILTGIDFNSAGCWRVSGEYSGRSLAFVVETVDAGAAQVAMKLFAVEITVGPNWDTSLAANEQAYFKDHSATLKRLRDDGHIVMGARYSDKGLIVFSAGAAADVRALMDQDPSMKAGTFNYEVHAFNVFYSGMVKGK